MHRSRSKPRPQRAGRDSGSTTVYGRDHELFNEEGEVFDALVRATKQYNHENLGSNIQVEPLQQVLKNAQHVVCPFVTTEIKSFKALAADMSNLMGAEVDISANVSIDTEAQIIFCFNILRSSFSKRNRDSKRNWFRDGAVVALLFVLATVWFLFRSQETDDKSMALKHV